MTSNTITDIHELNFITFHAQIDKTTSMVMSLLAIPQKKSSLTTPTWSAISNITNSLLPECKTVH